VEARFAQNQKRVTQALKALVDLIFLDARLSNMKVYVGTSGYQYFWNPGKPTAFEWYLSQGFNSVEINASFYRFPVKSWVNAWLKAPEGFGFSIKVHRSITHYSKFGKKSEALWERFVEPLKPLQHKIIFWLFQLPPSFSPTKENIERISAFFEGFKLNAVLEFRDARWWSFKQRILKMGVGFCSVDAPELPREIVCSKQSVYLRLHGRESWYSYVYSSEELDEIVSQVNACDSEIKAIYLNNDHGMLENALYLLRKLGIFTKPH
jgi:uncharacterized protein YecE (DUF72 family)